MKVKLRRGIVICVTISFATLLVFTLIEGRSSAASADAKVLSLSSWIPLKLNPEKKAWEQMTKDLEETTGGKYTIKVYDAQTLGKAKEHYELALKGVADISYVFAGYTPGRFPITDIASYASAPSSGAYTSGMLQMWKAGYMDKEYEKVKVLHVFSGTPSNFLWRKGIEPATSLADFKGRKIRVSSTGQADLVTALGASPVAMPAPEIYTSMERGVVDGAFTTTNVLLVFHLKEVCEAITRVNMSTLCFSLIMNRNKWNELPEAVKALFDRNAEKYAMLAAKGHDWWNDTSIEQVKPKFYDLPPSDLKKLKELQAPSVKAYIEKYEALGFPAKAAAQNFYQTLKKEYNTEPFLPSW